MGRCHLLRRGLLLLGLFALLAACDGSGGTAVDDALRHDASDAVTPADTTLPDAASDSTTPPADTAVDLVAPPPDAATDVAADPGAATWCRRVSEGYCALAARCPVTGGFELEGDDCVTRLAAGCGGDATVAALVADGALAFDGAAGEACLAALSTLSCATYTERLTTGVSVAPECDGVLVGQRSALDPCALGSECGPAYHCVFGDACPGQCEPYAHLGQSCETLRCDPDEGWCSGGVCATLPRAVGDACQETGFCESPLVCDRAAGTCRRPSLEGEACDPTSYDCFGSLLCVRTAAVDEGTCVPQRGRDEPCFEDAQCVDPDGAALVCAGGTCADASGVGEPCAGYLCADGWCDVAALPPVCRAAPGDGEDCANGSYCAPGLRCDAGRCAPTLAAGAACTTHAACRDGRCYGGVCVAPGAPPCPL